MRSHARARLHAHASQEVADEEVDVPRQQAASVDDDDDDDDNDIEEWNKAVDKWLASTPIEEVLVVWLNFLDGDMTHSQAFELFKEGRRGRKRMRTPEAEDASADAGRLGVESRTSSSSRSECRSDRGSINKTART